MRAAGRVPADGPVVLTGATGGVGSALARRLAERGAHLLLTGRDGAALEGLAAEVRALGGTAAVHPCDLRDGTAVAELARWVLATGGTPSAVVSAAGHSIRRSLPESSGRPHDLVRLVGTNLLGPAALLLALLEPMCTAGRGRVVAVTSATARIPVPGFAAYGASKAGLDAWLRAVRPEAAERGVTISVVELPLVATAMAAPTYGDSPRGALSPEQAADRVLRALDAPPGRRTLVSPVWARIGAVLAQAAPAASAAGAGRLARRTVVALRRPAPPGVAR